MDEVDDLYGDLLAFDDDLLPLETPKAGDEGKKRKAVDMLAEGGDVVVEQQLQQPQPQQQQQQKPAKQQKQQKQQQRADLASETSIPPGLDQGVRREGMHKTVFDRTTSAVPRREISSTPVMESKPSEVSERAIMPVDYATQPPKYVRYFILKSNNMPNLRRSVENAVWATQPHNEAKLNEAYHTADEVRLIFSVNQSGHFQGHARMSSPIGRGPKHGFWVGSSWGGLFQVDWEVLYNLPFHKVEHLANPLNEGKPVKIAKDGQEVPVDIAQELLRLMREGAKAEGMQKPEPQQKLYVDPAPYFGPTRESLRRQAYMNQSVNRMGVPDGFMGPGPPVERFSSGAPGHGPWRSGFHDRVIPGMDAPGIMGTPMDIRSGMTCSGPSSREPQEYDLPARGPPSWSGSDRRVNTGHTEPQNSKSPAKSDGRKNASPACMVIPEEAGKLQEACPSNTRNDPMEAKSEKEGSVKSPVNPIVMEVPIKSTQIDPRENASGLKEHLQQDAKVDQPSRKRERSPDVMSNDALTSTSPTSEKKRKHLYDLTYEEYLDQYYKFQDRLRNMISSGALWRLLGMGGSNGSSGTGPWNDANGTASFGNLGSNGPTKSGGGPGAGCWFSDNVGSTGSVNKPMLESEYVEYCRSFCGYHGFSFDEPKVREYYHRMRVQYESMRARGQRVHGKL